MKPPSAKPPEELNTTSSLEGLQSDEQRRVLDTVAYLRESSYSLSLRVM